MAFDEEAKAVQETAKAAQKSIDAASKFGGFMARFIEGPLEKASGILTDRLKFMRWERQVRFMGIAQDTLKEAGLEGPTRRIPMNIAVPLLEAATLEENDELQDTWARLFVNAANADSKVEIQRTFVSILQDMGALEARLLNAKYEGLP